MAATAASATRETDPVQTGNRGRLGAIEGLERVGRLLAQAGPTPEALAAVLAELQDHTGYNFAVLYLRESDELRLGAQRGYTALPERLTLDRGVIGRVCRTGRAECIPDVSLDPDYLCVEPEVVSEIAAPLLGEGDSLGVLIVESVHRGVLTLDDLILTSAIADRLASALLQHRAQSELRRRIEMLAAASSFARAVNAIHDPAHLTETLVDVVAAVVPSDTAVIVLADRSDGLYRVKAVRGLEEAAVGALITPGHGTPGRAISERTAIRGDLHSREEITPSLRAFVPYERVQTVGVPLVHEDAVLGVIALGRAAGGAAFTGPECEILSLLGAHAALALANARLMEEVSALAIRDGLTGLYNRRYFEAELDRAIARYRRREAHRGLAAIMFDLDHFGDFNRLYGHLAGDAALRDFAGVLQERLRSADLVARYGGEEFVVILEECFLDEAHAIAEHVREAFAARPLAGANGRVVHATVSAGCAVIDPLVPTRDALIGRADGALFKAKRAGRNCVALA